MSTDTGGKMKDEHKRKFKLFIRENQLDPRQIPYPKANIYILPQYLVENSLWEKIIPQKEFEYVKQLISQLPDDTSFAHRFKTTPFAYVKNCVESTRLAIQVVHQIINPCNPCITSDSLKACTEPTLVQSTQIFLLYKNLKNLSILYAPKLMKILKRYEIYLDPILPDILAIASQQVFPSLFKEETYAEKVQRYAALEQKLERELYCFEDDGTLTSDMIFINIKKNLKYFINVPTKFQDLDLASIHLIYTIYYKPLSIKDEFGNDTIPNILNDFDLATHKEINNELNAIKSHIIELETIYRNDPSQIFDIELKEFLSKNLEK